MLQSHIPFPPASQAISLRVSNAFGRTDVQRGWINTAAPLANSVLVQGHRLKWLTTSTYPHRQPEDDKQQESQCLVVTQNKQWQQAPCPAAAGQEVWPHVFFIAVSLHNNQNFAEQFEQVLELEKPPTGSLNITLLSKQGLEPILPNCWQLLCCYACYSQLKFTRLTGISLFCR